jgi:hypothetical protein
MTTPPDGTGPVGDVGAAAFPGLLNLSFPDVRIGATAAAFPT